MSTKFTFFIIGPSHHHFYYLVPFINASSEKEYCVIGATSAYHDILRNNFPNLRLLAFQPNDPKLLEYFNSCDVILHSNAYTFFENNIRPKLSSSIMFGFINHGASGKFTDSGYIMSNYLWDITVLSGKKDLDLLYETENIPQSKRLYNNPLIMKAKDGRTILIIQAGNLRVQSYFSARPSRQEIFSGIKRIDPRKKTILYMPTFSYNPGHTKKNYCSIPFFVRLLKENKLPKDFNYIVKLHPNLINEKEIVQALGLALEEKSICFHIDIIGGDYLKYMDISDLLISDRTSAFYDFLYFDKPIIFLDHNNECPENLAFKDITNSYWGYQCGYIISEKNFDTSDKVIEKAIVDDCFIETRGHVRNYCFEDGLSPETILQMMLTHPKYISKKQ
ncbi:MAG: CDP-glycerol glycerophosphotransferase family protein [Candidatus Marinimicrobia bacterium]|nr:CDP-glycerol glycerophosphotransferase family protein [Candidatus Neomarinimicrobiota bacterium]